jgi:hypothetical protein
MKDKKITAKPTSKFNKWKVVDIKSFKESYNRKVPNFKDLCEGKAVPFDESSNIFKQLNNNKIIVKE